MNKTPSQTLLNKDNETAILLGMRDQRGREIRTGRNLQTFLNHLACQHGKNWPLVFIQDWKNQNVKDKTP